MFTFNLRSHHEPCFLPNDTSQLKILTVISKENVVSIRLRGACVKKQRNRDMIKTKSAGGLGSLWTKIP